MNAELSYLTRKTDRQIEERRAEILDKLDYLQRHIARDIETLKDSTSRVVPTLGYVNTMTDAIAEAARLRDLLDLRASLRSVADFSASTKEKA